MKREATINLNPNQTEIETEKGFSVTEEDVTIQFSS